MQTFLPFRDFKQTAKVLDYKRLGKQRVEAYQLLLMMTDDNTKKGWKNHPAFKMWDGYDLALKEYALTVCAEWISRGYKDTLTEKISNLQTKYNNPDYPSWLGDEGFHASHRSALMYKNTEYYSQFNWSEPVEYNYKWMV